MNDIAVSTIIRKLIYKCYLKMVHLSFSFFVLIISFPNADEADLLSVRETTCKSCKINMDIDDDRLTTEDVKTVLIKLGLLNEEDDDLGNDYSTFEEGYKCGNCSLMEEVSKVLEEKEAFVEELEEAFKVYDRNGDGYITPTDIRRVMVILGIREGMRLECCKRMVQAFDQDGDGRICFNEFKMMMEFST